jgi:hypothetical protein
MQPGEQYWNAIDPIWDDIDIDTSESFQRTFQNVPPKLGLLYAAHFCQSEVCNGGFTQFFRNSTGVLAPEAIEGFAAIGQPQVADVVRRAVSMLGAPYPRDRAARWSTLAELAPGSNSQPISSGDSTYRNIEIFSPLEDEFYSVLKTDGGGFDNAADRYAAASGHENARPATESDKGALGRVPGGSSKADTEGLKNQLLDFKTSIAEMRKKLAEKTGDQRDESES